MSTCNRKSNVDQQYCLAHLDFFRGNAAGGVEVPPESGIDAIVSHALEEAGQHILRVEVGYAGGDGSIKTLRKFYRFQVSNPLKIRETIFRVSDGCCFVSISLENNGEESKGGLTVCEAAFEPASGLTAEKVGMQRGQEFLPTGTKMFDTCGRLEAGQTLQYLFRITSKEIDAFRGIAAGDELGKALFTWRKACGEMGKMASAPVMCPTLSPLLDKNDSSFVVHCKGKSGLSVDVAAAAAVRSATQTSEKNTIDQLLPVTVEPINPPNRMVMGTPFKIQLLVINHSEREMALQLQFHLEQMKGLTVCGPSFKNLQEIPGKGGSASTIVSFLPMSSGLLQIGGCCVVDLNKGVAFPQPPLCQVIVQ